MNIDIIVQNEEVSVNLVESGKNVTKISFDGKNNMTEKLLSSIDEVLKKGSVKFDELENITFKADVSDSYTSYRIAKTVVDSLNWAKQFTKN